MPSLPSDYKEKSISTAHQERSFVSISSLAQNRLLRNMTVHDDPASRTYFSRRLSCDIRFSTYSDAKLGVLFLENEFPIVLFKKVLDVVLDPAFKPEEVTFEDVWDLFGYVSARRRKDAARRESALITNRLGNPNAVTSSPRPSPGAEPGQTVTVTVMEAEADAPARTRVHTPYPGVVPPLVIDLVVDKLARDRVPLGVAATDTWWASAFQSNIEPFNSMSLVHRSWTSSAQRGLRQRAVVPYTHIDRFLLSPFCGPWINEMIVYWSVENGCIGVTKGDIWLLEALLERTPNLRSLAFNTSLVWPTGFPRPRFDVDICLEIISDCLPGLENLWLRHSALPVPQLEESLETCHDARSLCQQLPKLSSLKFVSIHSWGSRETTQPQDELDWDVRPPQLKAIELDLSKGLPQDELAWILKPREEYCVQSLSMTVLNSCLRDRSQPSSPLREALLDCIPQLISLRMCITGDTNQLRTAEEESPYPFYPDLLINATKLVSLEMLIVEDTFSFSNFASVALPTSLQRLSIHLYSDELQKQLIKSYEPPQRVSAPICQAIQALLNALPRLRSLLITGSRGLCAEMIQYWDMDDFIHHVIADGEPLRDGIPEDLSAICKERGVDLCVLLNEIPYRQVDTVTSLEIST